MKKSPTQKEHDKRCKDALEKIKTNAKHVLIFVDENPKKQKTDRWCALVGTMVDEKLFRIEKSPLQGTPLFERLLKPEHPVIVLDKSGYYQEINGDGKRTFVGQHVEIELKSPSEEEKKEEKWKEVTGAADDVIRTGGDTLWFKKATHINSH
jgi:hypothetical protein